MTIPINTGAIHQNPNIGCMVSDIKKQGLSSSGTMRVLTQEETTARKNEVRNKLVTLNVETEEIVSDRFTDAGDSITYNVEGVSFSNKQMQNLKGIVKNVLTMLPTKGSDLDYCSYASMGIVANLINSYAKDNLNTEQAEIANKSIADYLDSLIKSQAHYKEGVVYGSAGGSDYYGVNVKPPERAVEELRKEVDSINRLSDLTRSNLQNNITKATTTGGKATYATNMDLADSIRNEFSQADIRKSSEISKLLERYRKMIKPAYQEWGLSNTSYNQLLDNKIEGDINEFSMQISNGNAMIRNISNGNINIKL